ncbi:ScbR family autoregulator-binding transcription factor [Streptomyces beijiangensis]|uniref:TetR/AcrR family transcriptional regulator n=1 Tax=Streptomyces beijiangensis TaxID=163361 RepID=A0A939FBG9_9ACTN|nr:ScbR family autoregulator-binding transcription factor [Streptomyces beijiangensis]MBO0516201.1 TetR/AcrR family transcriptional regulator [Streptomyces beijiangensis]
MAKQLRAEQTRTTIVRAAAEVFDRYGYGTSSLSDIVAQGGVTKGALYFHFSSKEELAHTVMLTQHQTSIEAARQLAAKNLPGLEAVIRMSFELAAQLLNDPVVRAGIRLTLEGGAFQQPLPDPYRDWIKITADLLRQSVTELDIRANLDIDNTARFIVSAFTGVQLVTQVIDSRRALPARIADMWEVIIPGLVPPRKVSYHLGVVAEMSAETTPA